MRASREEWVRVIEEFGLSGQTHEGFCAARGLNVGSFRSWLYRLRRSGDGGMVARSATRLLPVRVGSTADDERVLELVAGETIVRLRGGLDAAYVADLIARLRERC